MTATVSLLENDGNYFPLSVYETEYAFTIIIFFNNNFPSTTWMK